MHNRSLGQLYGLIMDKGKIQKTKISFSTTRPFEARVYVTLMQTLLRVPINSFTIYLEDVRYGSEERAFNDFAEYLPELLQSEPRIFYHPFKNKPRLTIIYHDENVTKLISSFLKHVQILQKNNEFSQGFLDAILTHAHFDTHTFTLNVGYNEITPYLINSLEVLHVAYEQEAHQVIIHDLYDLHEISSFSELSKELLAPYLIA
ncbi:hypothetical protein COT72_00800 [archaeon CG10_big_fil_rev_8_21_14_0_10_43_11]|nr:MAG: hypothetical protein COT72_00800 [archaeon CG10_big_fil_rev_8_21_14_0_10_43_11]